jgi:hypothetical protein
LRCGSCMPVWSQDQIAASGHLFGEARPLSGVWLEAERQAPSYGSGPWYGVQFPTNTLCRLPTVLYSPPSPRTCEDVRCRTLRPPRRTHWTVSTHPPPRQASSFEHRPHPRRILARIPNICAPTHQLQHVAANRLSTGKPIRRQSAPRLAASPTPTRGRASERAALVLQAELLGIFGAVSGWRSSVPA